MKASAGRLARVLATDGGRRVPVVLLGLTLLAVAALAFQSYRVIDQELTEAALSRRASVSYLAATVLSEKLDRLTDIGISLSTRVRFRELIEAGKWDEASRILSSIPRDFAFIDRIMLNDPLGTMVAELPQSPGAIARNFADRDWFREVMRTRRPYVSQVYRSATPPPLNVFVAAIPIKSATDQMLGVLVLQVRTDAFFEWINGIEVGPRGFAYVVDRRGTLAAHPKFSPQGELIDFSKVPVVQRVLGGGSGVDIQFNPFENEQRVVAYEPAAKHGWGVIIEQPTVSAFAVKNAQLRRIMLAYALLLLALLVVFFLASRILLQRRQAGLDRLAKIELERRVVERAAQLEATNKELESFSYSISHDLRSPLRAIDGFAQMLQEGAADRLVDEDRRKLKVIRDNSQRMGCLIDDLLAFSRLGRSAVAVAKIDMTALAAEVFEELRSVPGSSRVEFSVKPMPAVCCDRALIRQVWVNLLANSIKFSGRKQGAVIEAGGYDVGAESVYYVKDNGAGFDMRYYDKLFGVFHRLHSMEEFPGTGVGLAIVQRVVDRHGGRVWAEGAVDEGATFFFALPVRSIWAES